MANLNGQLVIANGQYEFKHGDTDSEIQFVAYDMQGSKVSLQKDGSAKFVISNAMGVCKMPTATSAAGYIFKLKTSDLSALPAGNYTVELDVMDAKGGKRIFPVDNSNTVITITADALTVTNGVVPTTSLGDFENDLKNYTQQQTTQATNDIQSKFKDYADSLQNSVTAGVDKATAAANNALMAAQKVQQSLMPLAKMLQVVSTQVSTIKNYVASQRSVITELTSLKSTNLADLPVGMYQDDLSGVSTSSYTGLPPALEAGTMHVESGVSGSMRQVWITNTNKVYMRSTTPENTKTWSNWVLISNNSK